MRIFYINISDIDQTSKNVQFGYSYEIFPEKNVRVLCALVKTFI